MEGEAAQGSERWTGAGRAALGSLGPPAEGGAITSYDEGWPPPPPQPPPAAPPPPPEWGPRAPDTDGQAIAALVCAIGSFVLIPFVPAVVAVALASASRKRIAQSGGRLTGESLCTAALIVGWINIALCVLGGILGLILLVAWSREMDMIQAVALWAGA